MVKSVILMRHAEREDRALEKIGKDWISTAVRPQDPKLSSEGFEQAIDVARKLSNVGITKILCSPMIRTVNTADTIAEKLGFKENSVKVEYGLVEEAKSFRGKTDAEPRPNWNPLVLPIDELYSYSSKIDMNYKPLYVVRHERDESKPNTVREVHDSLTDRDEITRDRCKHVLKLIINDKRLEDDVVLLIAHGATVLAMSRALEDALGADEKIQGSRDVSCFAEFRPVDPSNPDGPWRSVTGRWDSGANSNDDEA